ncbi:hypothetical protein CTAYLR_008039 [Chrysophaeum taylorii]|uniref:M23ase beta-sheet core domain-containing protein n=1 Tax=Chrysophaeum taylorii TaxID=2483200 RepID=A0AAD7U6Z6_9STRA|nr:hypothetical protein CTAYLR_008039 [Chrysophaeum taylorii]
MVVSWLLVVPSVGSGDFAGACGRANFSRVMPSFPFERREEYVVRDLGAGPPARDSRIKCYARQLMRFPPTQGCAKFDVGRYNEHRPSMYASEHYANQSNAIDGYDGARDWHVGLDLGAPPGTGVYAPLEGAVFGFGYNRAPLDYGGVVVTQHSLEGVDFWLLYGHLSAKSVLFKGVGDPIARGQRIGSIGRTRENGGWPPHLHFQIALARPSRPHDMPGVVSEAHLDQALLDYPDPRLIVGPVY